VSASRPHSDPDETQGDDDGGSAVHSDARLSLTALPGVPVVNPGDDVGALACEALERARITPRTGRDVLVVTSKVISRAEGRFVDLSRIEPGAQARELAARTGKDAPLVELILRESAAVSRAAPGVLIVRHRLGFVSANAGIDASNADPRARDEAGDGESALPAPSDSGSWVLLLPEDPDAAARAIRGRIRERFGADLGVVVTDSHGRPFRLGTVGAAIGLSGLPALHDQRGGRDIFGRRLEVTVTAAADQVAAAADLVAGQGAEGRAMVHVGGLRFTPTHASSEPGARALQRPAEGDLYA
jgi:coenzyme F420-0:L-glutamate ligase/coenzyme F420-1:gamma-L-glutamate ligase